MPPAALRLAPSTRASVDPAHPAVIEAASGHVTTYGDLDSASCRLAHHWRSVGLRAGDHVAVLLENRPEFLVACWAAQRSGLYFTPINWHLHPDEATYVLEDCGATALVTSARQGPIIESLGSAPAGLTSRLAVDGDLAGFDPFDDALAASPPAPLDDEREGSWMFYSSGTTGRPKGIKPPLQDVPFGTGGSLDALVSGLFGFTSDDVYLCPAPLYHAAPLGWSMAVQRLGGTVVLLDRFDPGGALDAIAHHRVTRAQFVPTHFVRMLKLPEAERSQDVSSLELVVHAAAPCPIPVKEQMLDWFGPIIWEYYAGSEGNGFCAIGPEEWLSHKGSVGRPMTSPVHVVDEDGREVEAGETGQVWFESGVTFEYHNDPSKTAAAFDQRGWSSLGDIGWVDEDGYLYLTDRASHMIIAGGVNIYPQEVEDVLLLHPAVLDAAVIGVPDADLGEQVKAVVELCDPSQAFDGLAEELIEWCRARVALYKCPRSVDVVDALPRLPNGKLLKRSLRARYWP